MHIKSPSTLVLKSIGFYLPLVCFALLSRTVFAVPQQDDTQKPVVEKTQFRAALYDMLPWLPEGKNLDAAQKSVLDLAQQKAGREISLPQHPHDDLVLWQFQRYYPGGEADVDNVKPFYNLTLSERQHLYVLVTEDLLVARELLQDRNPEQQRIGLSLGDSVSGKLTYLLGDAALKLQVSETFILPYLGVAVVDPVQNLSRTELLKSACGIYLINGATAKYQGALRAFIVVAGEADSREEVNWAHVKLADSLARSHDYAGAIEQLKMVPDDSSLSPARDRGLPQLLRQMAEANQLPEQEK